MTDAQVTAMMCEITAHQDALARRRARILDNPLHQAILAVLEATRRPMRVCEVCHALRSGYGIIEPTANLHYRLLTLDRNGLAQAMQIDGRWHFQIVRESEGRI